MKKVLIFIISIFMFIPIFKADTYKTDFISINDNVFLEGNNYTFNIYKIERNDNNNLYIGFEGNSSYIYLLYLYDENYNEIGREKTNYYKASYDSLYLAKYKDDVKYYKFIYKIGNEKDGKEINTSEVENATLISTYSKYNDSNKNTDPFYFDNFNIDVDITKTDNAFNTFYNYNFDIVANEEIKNLEFDLVDYYNYNISNDKEDNTLTILANDEKPVYYLDNNKIIFNTINKGRTNIKISFTKDGEFDNYYGVYLRLYKNIYNNNTYDKINLNIKTNYNINKNDSFYCDYVSCYSYKYTTTDNTFSSNIIGRFDKEEFSIFVKDYKENIIENIIKSKDNLDKVIMILVFFGMIAIFVATKLCMKMKRKK